MTRDRIHVLHVEDDADDALLLHAHLAEAAPGQFRIDRVTSAAEAYRRLASAPPDVVLMDLSLPDDGVLETLHRTVAAADRVPVVVLTRFAADAWRTRAFEAGVEDYLSKGTVDGRMIAQALRSAIARHAAQARRVDQVLLDEVTGLYNRRGCLLVGQHRLGVAERNREEATLVIASLEGVEHIDATLGRQRADETLREMAQALATTARKSDLVARIGGDAFAVLATGTAGGGAERCVERLRAGLDGARGRVRRYGPVTVRLVAARYHPGAPRSLAELLGEAERLARTGAETRGPDGRSPEGRSAGTAVRCQEPAP